MKNALLLLPLPVLLLAACGGPPEEDVSRELSLARVQQALAQPNTDLLNGRTLNGRTLNGRTLNGTELAGVLVSVRYRGATYANGAPVRHLKAEQGRLVARKAAADDDGDDDDGGDDGDTGGRDVSRQGRDFIGAELVGNLGDGDELPLRIRDIVPGLGANSDLLLHDVEYQDDTGAWRPICVDAEGNRTLAVPVAGRWNHRSGVSGGGAFHGDSKAFTFACASGAVGKCVLLGYRPWAKHGGEKLADYHQACTRMVRADYCGKGVSYTRNGRVINVYDNLGLLTDTEPWRVEARWDEHGARCFRGQNRSLAAVPCYKESFEDSCGREGGLRKGELLGSEIQ
ncbi:MAG TPA: ADYC domain-containing protein [Myxococcaceae bacterium]|nr:ADYC domain-containing protein [Myxococcaceae bacterium]